MVLIRKPKNDELAIINQIIKKSGYNSHKFYSKSIKVRSMGSGSMGSLSLYPYGKINNQRTFGKELGCIQFKDSDGIEVIATIYLDNNEELFELDVWKTDYSELIDFPECPNPDI